jgi:hypothetical protein
MKKLLILIVLPVFLFTGCENRMLKVVANLKLDETLPVDKTGQFLEYRTITPEDVRADIDIPEEATIDEVNIESMSVQVVKLADNVATAVTISGYLQIGSETPTIFNDYTALLVGIDEPFLGLNSLVDIGVQRLRSKIEGYLKSTDQEPINLTVAGNSSPTAGNRIHANINIRMTGSITYHVCQNVPFFMGGEKCESQ